jgi:hypothetical protein
MIIESRKTLKRELSQFLFRKIVWMRPKKRQIIVHKMLSSNYLSSVKTTRSLGDLFMFRESKKSLKRTPGGFLFRITLLSPKK